MKILITGSQGRIGRRLMARFPEAIGLDRREGADIVADLGTIDLAAEPVSSLLAEVQAVIHLSGYANPEEAAAFHFEAVTNTARLLEACTRADVPHIVLASSNWAEPTDPRLKINTYGYSKRVIEAMAAMYSSVPGRRAVALRIGWVPEEHRDIAEAPDWLARDYWDDDRLFAEVMRALSG